MANQPLSLRYRARPTLPDDFGRWPERPLLPGFGYAMPPFIPGWPVPGGHLQPARLAPTFPIQPLQPVDRISPVTQPVLEPFPSNGTGPYFKLWGATANVGETPVLNIAQIPEASTATSRPATAEQDGQEEEQPAAGDGPPSWLDLLEGGPEGRQALFYSLLPRNASPTQALQFQSLFQPVFTQFLGELGSRMRAGSPEIKFHEFLAQSFDPQRALLRLPGARTGAGRGPTVFNFG
jgi:hypothetical protein